MKLNKKTLYKIKIARGGHVHAKLEFRNGSVAEFRVVKNFSEAPWLSEGRLFQLWPGMVEERVSKAKPMVLENK